MRIGVPLDVMVSGGVVVRIDDKEEFPDFKFGATRDNRVPDRGRAGDPTNCGPSVRASAVSSPF